MGADKSNLLGALLVTAFQQAAMGRGDAAADDRADFQFVVEEFSNFSTDGFAAMLSEVRKYGLCLTLSHQFVSQLPQVHFSS